MRNRTDLFLDSLEKYFKEFFSQKTTELGIKDIALYQRGYAGVANTLSEYPGCIFIIQGRDLTDTYTTTFDVLIGIVLSGDDPKALDDEGNLWMDILEDAFRSDWHLGGSCLDSSSVRFESDCTGNVFVIQVRFSCDVDLGGYVYDQEMSAVRISDEGFDGTEVPEVPDALEGASGEFEDPAIV